MVGGILVYLLLVLVGLEFVRLVEVVLGAENGWMMGVLGD